MTQVNYHNESGTDKRTPTVGDVYAYYNDDGNFTDLYIVHADSKDKFSLVNLSNGHYYVDPTKYSRSIFGDDDNSFRYVPEVTFKYNLNT